MQRYQQMTKEELIRELALRDEQLVSAVSRNEERYRSLFMSLREGFFISEIICDESGAPCDYRYLDVNPAFERTLGLQREAILNRRLSEVVPVQSPLWQTVFKQVATSGLPIHCCYHSEHFEKDFEIFAFRPAADQFAVLVTDITERKRTDQALRESEASLRLFVEHLRESEERYRDIVENQTEYVDRYLPGGIMTFVNNALADLMGVKPYQLLGRSFYTYLNDSDRERVVKTIESLSAENPIAVMEHALELTDGLHWLQWKHRALTDENGKIIEYQATGRDITDLKQMQDDLVTHQKELRLVNELLEQRVKERTADLEAAIRAQESFSYSVSHDLRAPLRHINSFSSMLIEEYAHELPPQACDYLDRICAASSRMGSLIDNLLELSRVTRAPIDPVKVDLSDLAYSILHMFQETERNRSVEVVIEQGITVMGDHFLLRQLLENLLGNSWKYTSKQGQARIEFGHTFVGGEEAYFVRDNGAGFDMAYQEKLFNAFERLHGAEYEGIGIGLATAQRIIQRHGGTIWGEGTPGDGATFYFTLPVYF